MSCDYNQPLHYVKHGFDTTRSVLLPMNEMTKHWFYICECANTNSLTMINTWGLYTQNQHIHVPFTLFDFDSNLVNISYTPCNDNGLISYNIIKHTCARHKRKQF